MSYGTVKVECKVRQWDPDNNEYKFFTFTEGWSGSTKDPIVTLKNFIDGANDYRRKYDKDWQDYELVEVILIEIDEGDGKRRKSWKEKK